MYITQFSKIKRKILKTIFINSSVTNISNWRRYLISFLFLIIIMKFVATARLMKRDNENKCTFDSVFISEFIVSLCFHCAHVSCSTWSCVHPTIEYPRHIANRVLRTEYRPDTWLLNSDSGHRKRKWTTRAQHGHHYRVLLILSARRYWAEQGSCFRFALSTLVAINMEYLARIWLLLF